MTALATIWQDLRFAARLLLRTPGFTVIAVAALAIGIGANTAIFTAVNTLLLEPLPYKDPARLAVVWEHNLPRDRKNNVVSPGNFLHWREMNRVFDDLAAVSMTFRTTLTGNGAPEELPVQYVTSAISPILGVPPQLGRLFTVEDDSPSAHVVSISDRLWRRRFGADPGIINRTILLDGVSQVVIGVMPPGFSILDKNVDIWSTIGFRPEARTPRGRWIMVVGRIRSGVTIAQAQDDMARVHAELTRMFPAFNTGWTARVVSLSDQLTGDVRPALLVMLGAVGFVLLIACANVANLLLARATARHRELAVRAALGAGRGRLVRQLLAESVLLSAVGGAAGLLLAWWATIGLRNVVARQLPISRLESVTLDTRVLLFTLGAVVVSGLAFGLIPALSAAGATVTDALKEGGRGGTAARSARMRNTFVVIETALALILLVGAGLLIRSFGALLNVDPGFDPSHTITMKVSIPTSKYESPQRIRAFYDQLFERIDAIPGVQAAGGTSFLPLNGLGAATGFEIVGRPKPAVGQGPVTDVRVSTHDYFRAMGIRLVRGRLFDRTDAGNNVRRVIISESMARTYWPNEDPIGQHVIVNWYDQDPDEIVGVVGDVRQETLEKEVRPSIYWPPSRFAYPFMTVAIRATGDVAAVVPAATDAVHALDPNIPVADVRTMNEIMDISVAQRRMTMLLLGAFAGMALLLAAVGIYGVISYTVTQRTQEIGIRMALGAQRADVLSMVVRQAMGLAALGIVIGAGGALLLTGWMRNLLFDVRPSDPLTFVTVAVLLGIVAGIAASVPGLRATRVDPVVALRAE
jgi:putative ABC transport system permease protein